MSAIKNSAFSVITNSVNPLNLDIFDSGIDINKEECYSGNKREESSASKESISTA